MGPADFSQFVVTAANEAACEVSTLNVYANKKGSFYAAFSASSGSLFGSHPVYQSSGNSPPFLLILCIIRLFEGFESLIFVETEGIEPLTS